MALLRDKVFKRAPSLWALLQEEVAKVNLKPLKKITIKFDPFHENVSAIRRFAHLIHERETLKTNSKCIIKTEIQSDRSDPSVVFDLTDGKEFIFKCKNLTCLEILQLTNQYISSLAPPEEEFAVVDTKKPAMKKKK